jgi:hypothetical protein
MVDTFLASSNPQITIQVIPSFPAQVIAGAGVDITKSGVVYEIGLDFANLVELQPGWSFADRFVPVLNLSDEGSPLYELAPLETLPSEAEWTAQNITVTAETGTFTLATGSVRLKRNGKTVHVNGSVVITTNGTAAGAVLVNMPYAALEPTIIAGRDDTTNNLLQGRIDGGVLALRRYDGIYPGASGRILRFSGTYETQD